MASGGRDGNGLFAIQIGSRQRVALQHLFRCALKNDFSAEASGSRSHIDHIVCRQHHVFVVLHDNHRVADVPQFLQRADESAVVALVESDARFVEDVEHVHELAADLRGEADALAFSAREGEAGSVQGKVVQSDVQQEAQSGEEFFQNLVGDGAVFGLQPFFDVAEPVVEFGDVHAGEFRNVLSVNPVAQRFSVQSRSVADGTRRGF